MPDDTLLLKLLSTSRFVVTENMKPDSITRLFSPMHIALAFLFTCNITTTWAADYASLITQTREQLQNECFTEALATAQEAVLVKSKDYRGHYFVAMAQMSLGQFDEADVEVANALSHAPKSAKVAVMDSAETIKTSRKSAGEDKGIGKAIFLSCKGTEKIIYFDSTESELSGIERIYRIRDHLIDEWDRDKGLWNTKLCSNKQMAEMNKDAISDFKYKVTCDTNVNSIVYEENFSYKTASDIIGNHKKFLINKITGEYEYVDIWRDSTISVKGICQPTTDPSSAVGNKSLCAFNLF